MGLVRLLLIIAIVWLVLVLARRLLDSGRRIAEQRKPRLTENMVRCERCGLHVPESEAVRRDGHNYCSPAHRDAAR